MEDKETVSRSPYALEIIYLDHTKVASKHF